MLASGSGASRGSSSRPPRHVSGHHFIRKSPPPPPRPPYNPPSPPSPSGHYGGGSTPSYGYSAPPRPRPQRSFGPPPAAQRQQSKEQNKPKPKPKPKPPTVDKYLKTDDQYQRDRAALIKNFKNMRLANAENRGNVKMDRGTTLSRLKEEQAENLKEMQDDFAARGLFGGAEYLNKENDFNTDYLEQRSDTRRSASRNIQQLLRDLRNAKTLRDENISQAKLEAIRRRAAEFGLKG